MILEKNGANGFGVETLDPSGKCHWDLTAVRGNGKLRLLETGVEFAFWNRPDRIFIPIEKIIRVELGKSHNGKWILFPKILKIYYAEAGATKIFGVAVGSRLGILTGWKDDADEWKTRIERLLDEKRGAAKETAGETVVALGEYRHTQSGTLTIVFTTAAILGVIAAFVLGRMPLPVFIILILLFSAVELLFMSLTVRVDRKTIRLWFGPGLIRKTIALSDVVDSRPVRNSPLCGWGIRYIGNGWLYNISGLDAVEMSLKTGRRIRIGTDDPDGLHRAIQQAAAASRHGG